MTPDIKLRDFYLQFKHQANIRYNNEYKNLQSIIDIKNRLIEEVKTKRNIIEDNFNIKLDNYKEWTDNEYNDKESLYLKTVKIYKENKEDINIQAIIALMRYCNIIRREFRSNEELTLLTREMNIKLGVYRDYLCNFFNRVHKIILEGDAFKLGNNIGTIILNYVDMKNHKQIIDYTASRKKKAELKAAGKKIYNSNEAIWYKARNIPYEAESHIVYKDTQSFYKFVIFSGGVLYKNKLIFEHSEYINKKYRGLTQKQVADTFCKNKQDVYDLQTDIKYKLNVLLYKKFVTHLTYVRNTKSYKYKRGQNYS